MPPKTRFTRTDVISASFDVAKAEGIHALTARKIASQLKSSTAPVYSHFEAMEELKREVLLKTKDLLFEYSIRPYTDRVFLNMGVGIAVFARDYPMLFRALFLETGQSKDIVVEYLKSLEERMIYDERFTSLPAEERRELLKKMWIFTQGLASLICAGLLDDDSDESIKEMLLGVGTPVIQSALGKQRT